MGPSPGRAGEPGHPKKGIMQGSETPIRTRISGPRTNFSQRLSHLRAIVMDPPAPSPDDSEDLLLSCRYGDIDDVKSFIDRFGRATVGEARDENGNNVLHMASANGHLGESNRAHTHTHTHTRSTDA